MAQKAETSEAGCGMAASKAAQTGCGKAAGEGQCAGAALAGTGMGCGDSRPIENTTVQQGIDAKTGAPLEMVGAKLAGLAPTPVATLLGSAERFAGKTIRLEGDVSGMCTHRRKWFTVQATGDRSGQWVRVISAPAFLVPPEAVGKRVRAEGTVELVDTPAGKNVVLRATGAEFL
jgi:hypothetical protein